MDIKSHWEKIYETKAPNEVSWFQPYPKISMDFIEMIDLPLHAYIIDIGGGDSHFVDALLDKGYKNVYVLDISENAIERAKKRLGARANQVNWIVSDITEFEPPIQFDFWHDRAAFHFLTSEEKIHNYVSIAKDAVKKNGYLLIGTFSDQGPKKCSGIDIKQYSEASMSVRFASSFTPVRCILENHTTPSEAVQNFLFCTFRKH